MNGGILFMRFILLNDEKIITAVRFGKNALDNEIQSDTGEIGQQMLEDGTFVDIDHPILEPAPTIEEKLTGLEQQLQEQQTQNLILVDINLTVYEELLSMKAQLSQLAGATDNA